MTFAEFIKDLTRELKENKDWADREVRFATIDRGDLEYLSVYDLDNTVCIDIGTEEDSDEHTKRVLGG